jgi:hypothetical protein
MTPLYANGNGNRYNLDGFLVFSDYHSQGAGSYFQLFRNGAIEGVTDELLEATRDGVGKGIPAGVLGEALINFVERARRLYQKLSVAPPISMFMSLSGVKDKPLIITDKLRFDRAIEPRPIDREICLLPDVLEDSLNFDPIQTCRPLQDALWQASGLQRCFYYNDKGNWTRG